jgi:hypothetical protein
MSDITKDVIVYRAINWADANEDLHIATIQWGIDSKAPHEEMVAGRMKFCGAAAAAAFAENELLEAVMKYEAEEEE